MTTDRPRRSIHTAVQSKIRTQNSDHKTPRTPKTCGAQGERRHPRTPRATEPDTVQTSHRLTRLSIHTVFFMHLWPNAYGLWIVFRLPVHQRMRRDMHGLESKRGPERKRMNTIQGVKIRRGKTITDEMKSTKRKGRKQRKRVLRFLRPRTGPQVVDLSWGIERS